MPGRRRWIVTLLTTVSALACAGAVFETEHPSGRAVRTYVRQPTAQVATTGSSEPASSIVSVPVPALSGPVPVGAVSIPTPGSMSSPPGSFVDAPPSTAAEATSVCPATEQTSASLDISLTSAAGGFTQHCYYVDHSTDVSMTITNDLIVPSTGLTPPLSLYISREDSPALAAIANAPGSWTLTPSSSSAIESPTANDNAPVSFILPALQAGTYLIQTYPQYYPSAVLEVE